ncbi:hypothetical protein C8R44DRAFT_747045 [Mycena epipterygia]|nr:hypothetical protein C8R44DRAFT_747045 [Mycena epipterygia]
MGTAHREPDLPTRNLTSSSESENLNSDRTCECDPHSGSPELKSADTGCFERDSTVYRGARRCVAGFRALPFVSRKAACITHLEKKSEAGGRKKKKGGNNLGWSLSKKERAAVKEDFYGGLEKSRGVSFVEPMLFHPARAISNGMPDGKAEASNGVS